MAITCYEQGSYGPIVRVMSFAVAHGVAIPKSSAGPAPFQASVLDSLTSLCPGDWIHSRTQRPSLKGDLTDWSGTRFAMTRRPPLAFLWLHPCFSTML